MSGAPHEDATAAELIAAADLEAAARATAGVALRIPPIASEELSQLSGTDVTLKAECLQRAGSFKIRGALSKLAALTAEPSGLVAASAGNHGRAVAYAARARGVACTVFMPIDAAVSKVLAVERLGASVHLEGASVEEALALAAQCARESTAALVHPFDDIDVIAGQGTLGLELLEEVPDLARVLVPVGGGGLASGVGIALRRARPDVELVGVQAQACAPFVAALGGEQEAVAEPAPGATIADGIAIKQPGRLTLPLLRELLSDLVVVSEDEIAQAIVFLAERTKLVSEGAGAVATAALLSGRCAARRGTTVAVVSGGNVDSGLLGGLLRRRETEEGRRVRIFTRVSDRPGGLAELLGLVAGARANVVSVEHVREAVQLHVRETGVELTLETRGPEHTEEVLAALKDGGYEWTVE